MAGITDRIKNAFRVRPKANPHEANSLLRVGIAGARWALEVRKKYSDIYFWTVANKIFAGMRSVDFTHGDLSGRDEEVADALCNFIESNIVALLWQWWGSGYIVVRIVNATTFEVVSDRNIHKTANGDVIEPKGERWVVLYSNEYLTSRLSAFQIITNELDEIDALRASDDYLTRSLGALGIISGKEMPMVEEDKENFLDEMKDKVGSTPDKYQFIIATGNVSYTPIQVPIADLKFADKEKRCFKLICDYFNVPFDLVSFSGASTYANMETALKMFYSNCIAANAEVLLEVARYIVRRLTVREFLGTSDTLTFRIDNTAMVVDERQQQLDQLKTAAETSKAMQDAGIDTTEFNEKITEEIQ